MTQGESFWIESGEMRDAPIVARGIWGMIPVPWHPDAVGSGTNRDPV
jgi:hypothetical protein